MTRIKENIIIIILILIELLIIINQEEIISNIYINSKLYITKIFPSLFPTMLLGLLLVKNNVQIIIPKFIKKIFNKLFNFDDNMTTIFISSMICGAPNNAIFINEYLNNNLIDEKTAENLLCCTHFINPLFVISITSVMFSIKISILILITIFLSNLIKAYILKKHFKPLKKQEIIINNNFIQTFNISVKTALNTSINIFGLIIIFNILISLITNIIPLNNYINTLINMLLEMTSGLIRLNDLNINNILKIILTYYSLSFGGICIIMQTISQITNKNIKYKKYFMFRLF